MLSNTEWSIYNFRSELIKKLLSGCCGVIRAGGKRPFATYKSRYGLVQTRFMGLVKNMTAYGIAAIAYNLRKGANFLTLYGLPNLNYTDKCSQNPEMRQ